MKSKSCPLTKLSGIDNEVFCAIAFRENQYGIEPPTEIKRICEEILTQRWVSYKFEKRREEHPSIGDKLAMLVPFGIRSKLVEPRMPSEMEVAEAVARLETSGDLIRLPNGGWVRSYAVLRSPSVTA